MKPEIKVTKIASLTGHSGSIYALADPLNNGFILSGGSDKIVAQWNLNAPGDGEQLAKTNEVIYSLLPNGETLLVGQAAGGIHVVNLESKNEIRLLQYHKAPVFDLALSKKHQLIFTLSGDGELGVLDRNDFSLIKKLQLGTGKLRAVAVNKLESIVAIGAADGSIYTFSLPEVAPLKHWQAHQPGFSVNALCFSPDENYLLSGSRDAHMNVYDVKNNFELVKSIPAHNYAIYAIAYHPSLNIFATASRDKTIKLWDSSTFEVLLRIDKEKNDGHVNSVNKLIWHQASGHLITGSDDRSVMIWKVS